MSLTQLVYDYGVYTIVSMEKLRPLEKLMMEVKKQVENNDPAHDFEHVMRVYKNAQRISKKEGANLKLVLTAVLLHDIVSHPKSDPRSKNSSKESAKKAKEVLQRYGYKQDEVEAIADAIRDHSFSKGVVPKTLEGKILQDADRLDAIGAIGIARVFSVAGSEGRLFYNSQDPFCVTRSPDDTKWTLDHFYKKLLLLEKRMNTKTAKREAKGRIRVMRQFLGYLQSEI
jgi:uncharacterized protein